MTAKWWVSWQDFYAMQPEGLCRDYVYRTIWGAK